MYDAAVIGAGPGGYLCSQLLTEKGYSVVLFEESHIGGVCLNEGCIPTKFYLNKVKELKLSGVKANDDLLLSWKREIDEIRSVMRGNMENTLRGKGVNICRNRAHVKSISDEKIEIYAGDDTYVSKQLVLAVGSKEMVPNIGGLKEAMESGFVQCSNKFIFASNMLQHITIIGGGIIGLEFAVIWNRLGCEVTILEKESNILPFLDDDVRKLYTKELEKKGINIICSASVEEVDHDEKCVVYSRNGKQELIDCDRALLACGRKSRLEFADEIKEIFDCDGFDMQDKKIYRIGDCNGKRLLAHAAYEEAKSLVECMDGAEAIVAYELIPSVIYTSPELAWVGKTEKDCSEQEIDYYSCKKDMRYSGKYYIENKEEQGVCKLIFEKTTNRLIGAQLVGNGSAELITFIKLAIQTRMTKKDLAYFTPPHPSLAEIVSDTVN